MLLVDVHTHLDDPYFSDKLDSVISNAKSVGVTSIITSGTNTASNRAVLELSEKYDIVKASFGLYPIDALNISIPDFGRNEFLNVDAELEWIKKNKNKCIAVGEVGMDYHWVKGKEKEQKLNFQKVIDLVEKIKKPIVIHSRKAELDCIELLESSSIKKVVMHSFGGKKSLISRSADNGWYFSIPPVITRLQHFSTLVSMVNINQLLTETDAPYLSPFRDRRNEPAFIVETIKKIAELKGMTEEDVASNIYMNYSNVFL